MSWRFRLLELVGRWLSDLGRWVVERLGVLYGWLRSLDDRRLSLGLLVVGLLLATGSVVFGGFFSISSTPIARPVYAIAVLIPLFGVVLTLYALRLVGRYSARAAVAAPLGNGIEQTERESWETVAIDTRRRLSGATDARYRCRSVRSAEVLREQLLEGAIRVVRTRDGLSPAAAREAVRRGRWTEDPVAAGFLGEDVGLPIGERVRAAIDPGRAYRRRVRRTVAAIEAVDPTATPATNDDSRDTDSGNVTTEVGV